MPLGAFVEYLELACRASLPASPLASHPAAPPASPSLRGSLRRAAWVAAAASKAEHLASAAQAAARARAVPRAPGVATADIGTAELAYDFSNPAGKLVSAMPPRAPKSGSNRIAFAVRPPPFTDRRL